MNAEEVYALLNKKIKKGGITDDKIKQIVEQHFEENPVQVITDNTLSVAGTPADALATGTAIDSLKEDLADLDVSFTKVLKDGHYIQNVKLEQGIISETGENVQNGTRVRTKGYFSTDNNPIVYLDDSLKIL